MNGEQELLTDAIISRSRRDYLAAAGIYKNIIRNSPNSPEAQIALVELRNAYHDFADWSDDHSRRGVMRAYLQQQANGHPNQALKRQAKMLHAGELVANEEYIQAERDFQSLLASSSSDGEKLRLVYSLFSLHLFGTGDRVSATEYLRRLQRDWPNDKNTKFAERMFATTRVRPNRQSISKPETEGSPGRISDSFVLDQNYPNPFNPTTTIRFQIPNDGVVSLKVFNMLGQEVATLVNEAQPAGSYSVPFDGSKLSSGVYIYTLKAGSFTASKKFLLIK
jgi:tetratricopeptide (TPR) repeat protein